MRYCRREDNPVNMIIIPKKQHEKEETLKPIFIL